MRKDKEKIFNMRKSGMTYRAIEKETGVSRATLTKWFKNEEWSLHLKQINTGAQVERSTKRVIQMNAARSLKLESFYSLQESEAAEEYKLFRKDPLFWAGLMVYAGEGDKRSRHIIRVSNSEAYIHRIFCDFLARYLSSPRNLLRCALLLYPDNNELICKEYWSQQLFINTDQFHKTQFLQGKEPIKRLQYGVGITIMTNTGLKKKLLKWLELAQEESFAVIV
ncbi:MAG: hypothetical protein JWL92_83 [Candidatus Nomurabacteria bacterium]|nr:hypothetical protein [Candidatus Nomurabacteria bacterium]